MAKVRHKGYSYKFRGKTIRVKAHMETHHKRRK